MLVQVRAVEISESVRVGRKVRRHPVEDHADAVLVQDVDQLHEVLRRAVAGGRREIAGRLVAPRAVERMLGDRHQLDVGESLIARVLGERQRDVAISRQLCGVPPSPRSKMHLVDRNRRIERVVRFAVPHPRRVLPRVVERPGTRRGRRWDFRVQREGIGLVYLVRAVGRNDAVLVGITALHAGDLALPDAGAVGARRKRICGRVPAVECADDRHARCVGRPDTKRRAAAAKDAAHRFVKARVRALAKKVDVLFTKQSLWPPGLSPRTAGEDNLHLSRMRGGPVPGAQAHALARWSYYPPLMRASLKRTVISLFRFPKTSIVLPKAGSGTVPNVGTCAPQWCGRTLPRTCHGPDTAASRAGRVIESTTVIERSCAARRGLRAILHAIRAPKRPASPRSREAHA